jgi:hypothetical protein
MIFVSLAIKFRKYFQSFIITKLLKKRGKISAIKIPKKVISINILQFLKHIYNKASLVANS